MIICSRLVGILWEVRIQIVRSRKASLERQGERIPIQTEKAIDISNYSDMIGNRTNACFSGLIEHS